MPRTFSVNYLAKEVDFAFDSQMIKLLKKAGFICLDTQKKGRMRILVFRRTGP